ncbi:MAG: hypothetical protein ACOYMA_08790 [Bacteroidia bacterium]
MINFEYFYENHFDSKNIIDTRFGNFTVNHIARLTSNNGAGVFNTILSATSTCYSAYYGNQADVSVAEAVKKSLTNSLDGLIDNFKADVSKYAKLVSFTFSEKESTILEFFPSGLSEYSQVTKGNIELLADRLATAFNKYSTDFDATIVTKFNTYVTNLQSARNAQLQKFGNVDSSKTKTQESRTALELQLLVNMHTIGGLFPGEVERCVSFFDQSLLLPAYHQQTWNIELKTNEIQTPIEKQFAANAEINISTNQTIEVGLSNVKDQLQKYKITINANEQTTLKLADFNVELNTHPFLVIKNIGAENAAVKVEL